MKNALVAALVIGIAACSSPEDISERMRVTQEAAPEGAGERAQEALDRRLAADAKAFSFTQSEGDEETGLREFTYSWPRQVAAIPALNAAFEAEFKAAQADQEADWSSALADCPPDAVTCRNNYVSIEWQVVADTPRFLSLSSSVSTYTGGAHGNYGRGSSVWDREAGQRLKPLEFFTSTSALEDALGKLACDALNQERAKRRGGAVEVNPQDWSSACVPMDDTVLFLGSSTGKAFDRIGVYYGPYVAGPYAEGDFEFTLPVTPSVIEAVRPDYRGAFVLASPKGA